MLERCFLTFLFRIAITRVILSCFEITPTHRFGKAQPLEDSRAEEMCRNWYKPISMANYQSIISSLTVLIVLVTPTKPSKLCILVVVSVP